MNFCLSIAASKNLIKLNSTIPILLVGYFLPTDSALGFYKIALAYVMAPMVLLDPVTRLLNVQFPQTLLGGFNKLWRRFLQVTIIALLLSAAIALPMILAAPFLIRLLFPDYEPSINLIYALAIYPLFVSLGIGLGPLFRTLNKMKAAIMIQLLTLLLLLPSSYFLIKNFAIRGLIITTLVFTLIPNILSFMYLFFNVSQNDRRKDF